MASRPSTPTLATSPLLGTPYILSQSPHNSQQTQRTAITPSLCSNLSAFKSVLRSSRSLDDAITLRLNRASALARTSNPYTTTAAELSTNACDGFWQELTNRWNERTETLTFCDAAVAQNVTDDRSLPVENGLDREAMTRGRGDSELQVKRRQIHNEIDVESIVRARSLAFFASKCPSHPQQPAPTPLPKTSNDLPRVVVGMEEAG